MISYDGCIPRASHIRHGRYLLMMDKYTPKTHNLITHFYTPSEYGNININKIIVDV